MLLARLYASAVFKLSFVVLVAVFLVLVADQSASAVRAILEPVVIVAGIVMLLAGAANRWSRQARS
jgi:hypothetical protein